MNPDAERSGILVTENEHHLREGAGGRPVGLDEAQQLDRQLVPMTAQRTFRVQRELPPSHRPDLNSGGFGEQDLVNCRRNQCADAPQIRCFSLGLALQSVGFGSALQGGAELRRNPLLLGQTG